MDEFRQFGHFGSIIIVTTDAILTRCISSQQPPGENRIAWSIALKKIRGWAEKNRVGWETGTIGIFSGLINAATEISTAQTSDNVIALQHCNN
jgi:hypothetical protein